MKAFTFIFSILISFQLVNAQEIAYHPLKIEDTITEFEEKRSGIYSQARPVNLPLISQLIKDEFSAIDDRIEGNVNVNILVDRDGQYIRHRMTGTYSQMLCQAIDSHITNLSFYPAKRNGMEVAAWVPIRFSFTLEE